MNKKMKIAIPVVASVVAITTGIGLAAAKSGNQDAAQTPSTNYAAETTSTVDSGTVPQFCGGATGAGMMGQAIQVTTQRVATLLGTTTTDLQTQLQSGKTLAGIATEKGVTQEALTQTILGPMTDQMNLMVKYGYLTQDQADAMLQRMNTAVQTLTTSKITDLNGFGFMGQMMGNGGFSGTGGAGCGNGSGPGGMMGGFSGAQQGTSLRSGGMMGGAGRGGMMGNW